MPRLPVTCTPSQPRETRRCATTAQIRAAPDTHIVPSVSFQIKRCHLPRRPPYTLYSSLPLSNTTCILRVRTFPRIASPVLYQVSSLLLRVSCHPTLSGCLDLLYIQVASVSQNSRYTLDVTCDPFNIPSGDNFDPFLRSGHIQLAILVRVSDTCIEKMYNTPQVHH